jgi:hypothetical protein
MINRQKVYNKVRKHLLTQNRQALESEEGEDKCRYRTYDPNTKRVLKCALGCLIPFHLYDPKIEGGTPGGKFVDAVLTQSLPGYERDTEDALFLEELQMIHDSSKPTQWKKSLDAFTATWELEVQS